MNPSKIKKIKKELRKYKIVLFLLKYKDLSRFFLTTFAGIISGKFILVSKEECGFCNKKRNFYSLKNYTLKRESFCFVCGTILRSSAILKNINGYIKSNSDKKLFIYNTASCGNVHNYLKDRSDIFYVYSDYIDDVKSGHVKDGMFCQDLEDLSFPEAMFDIVITEEVLEHVHDYKKAFKEIARVLKNGGIHIFTVPYHENIKTLHRVINNENIKPLVIHGDYIRSAIPVATDFGYDMIDIIKKETGENTEIIYSNIFFEKSEITDLTSDEEYSVYKDNENNLGFYFKYNNVIFVSTKMSVK